MYSNNSQKSNQKPKNRSGIPRLTCYNCQRKGHYASDCPAPKEPRENGQQNTHSGRYQQGNFSAFSAEKQDVILMSAVTTEDNWTMALLYTRLIVVIISLKRLWKIRVLCLETTKDPKLSLTHKRIRLFGGYDAVIRFLPKGSARLTSVRARKRLGGHTGERARGKKGRHMEQRKGGEQRSGPCADVPVIARLTWNIPGADVCEYFLELERGADLAHVPDSHRCPSHESGCVAASPCVLFDGERSRSDLAKLVRRLSELKARVLSHSRARSSVATSHYNQCVLFYILVTRALARSVWPPPKHGGFLTSRRTPTVVAPISVPPPLNLSFRAEDWPIWSRRFRRFRQGSNLSSQSEERQVDVQKLTECTNHTVASTQQSSRQSNGSARNKICRNHATHDEVLRRAGGAALNVLGVFQSAIEWPGHHSLTKSFVVDILREPLVDILALEALLVFSWLQEVSSQSPLKTHKSFFSGLGKMTESYKLRLHKEQRLGHDDRIPVPLNASSMSTVNRVGRPLIQLSRLKVANLTSQSPWSFVSAPGGEYSWLSRRAVELFYESDAAVFMVFRVGAGRRIFLVVSTRCGIFLRISISGRHNNSCSSPAPIQP
uniref:CCHC-type domain-containing protein n=1 Tax=Timema douglasi TaxID=61478 RepID=A0A7R8VLJ1_TIMDO|nr:unnamed protein product [Timema douglasi]